MTKEQRNAYAREYYHKNKDQIKARRMNRKIGELLKDIEDGKIVWTIKRVLQNVESGDV